jgi:hypothetical protein
MKSAIDLAGVLLKHRRSMLDSFSEPELKVYERVSGELLSRTIWKYSEARGKFRGNPIWSRKALAHFDEVERQGEKLFRHEHVFPQIRLIMMLRKLESPEPFSIRPLYERYAIAAVVLKEENELLNRLGRGQSTVDGAFDNPWLRYCFENDRIQIVENELIPKWHLTNLRKANLLFQLSGPSHGSVRKITMGTDDAAKRAYRKSESAGARERYYRGPFPPLETKLRFQTTDNPKKSGTAAWVRFEQYFKANPTTVSEFLSVGGTPTDIRYDLWHEYIALDPDPRRVR